MKTLRIPTGLVLDCTQLLIYTRDRKNKRSERKASGGGGGGWRPKRARRECRHLWKKVDLIDFLHPRTATPFRILARVSDDNSCKPQKVLRHNHVRPLSRWRHFCRLSINSNFSFPNKRRMHFFSKDIKSSSICCSADPCLVKSSVLR